MAYINVDEVYILDNTGLQVDMATDIPFADAGFSDAQKEQARKNIGAGGTNPNQLDNPWFGSGEVVNQRGVTSGSTTNATYFIDRWLTTYGSAAGTYSVGSGGITLTPANGTTATMYQKLANASAIDGKAVTASVLLSDGTIYSGTITRANGSVQNYYYENGIRIRQVTDNGFHIDVSLNGGVTIRASKLELGTVSTLANDTPPDYGTELMKCMRYFQRIKASAGYAYIGTGVCFSAYLVYSTVTLPVPLRTTSVTTSVSGTLSVQVPGSFLDSSSNNIYVRTPSTIMINSSVSGATTGQGALLTLKNNGDYIDISADL